MLVQVIKALNRVSLFCFFGLFLYLVQKPKQLNLKENIVPKLQKVIVQVCVSLNPPSKDSLMKMPLAKLSFFRILYFWSMKRKSTKTIMEWCFSCQNKSVCQKLPWSYKKMKIDPKCDICPFYTKAFNYVSFTLYSFWVGLNKALVDWACKISNT